MLVSREQLNVSSGELFPRKLYDVLTVQLSVFLIVSINHFTDSARVFDIATVAKEHFLDDLRWMKEASRLVKYFVVVVEAIDVGNWREKSSVSR